MRLSILVAAACLSSCPTIAQTQDQQPDNETAAKHAPWPLQLEMRVPFEPAPFPSGQHVYLMYELHLTNFMPMPVSLSRIEVLDADAVTSKPIATFETAQLETMLQPLGVRHFPIPETGWLSPMARARSPLCLLRSPAAHIFPTDCSIA
jgi:hypothetical protein